MTYAIEITNLVKQYVAKNNEIKYAIHDLTLNIPKGSFFALLGPNGAGKSTLINILSGLAGKTSGRIKIFGDDISKGNQYKHKIGTCIQDIVLDPLSTTLEYLTNTAGYYGISPKRAQNKIDEVIEYLDLKDFLNKRTRVLSGGMKRRLIIAKALIHDPEIIILDEPTAGVDVELRLSIWRYIQKLNKDGKTILLTTHYLEEAQELSNDIAFINQGKILLQDTKTNVMQNIISTKSAIISVQTSQTALALRSDNFAHTNIDDKTLKIIYDPQKTNVAHIIQELATNNYIVTDISMPENKLEDIFIHIMKTNKQG